MPIRRPFVFFITGMFCLFASLSLYAQERDAVQKPPDAVQSQPTVITSINNENIAIWPTQLPKAVQDSWDSVVPIYISIDSKDKQKPLPPVQRQGFGTGYLIHPKDSQDYYVLSVAHIFDGMLRELLELTKYSSDVLIVSAYLVDSENSTTINGIPLDLIAFESDPYDMAVFRLRLPQATSSLAERLGIQNQKSVSPEIDWTSLEVLLPNQTRRLRAAKPVTFAELEIGMPVHIAGFTALFDNHPVPFHEIGFLASVRKNVKVIVGTATHTLKRKIVLRGDAVHGLSGSAILSETGEFIGILRGSNQEGCVVLAVSADDFKEFADRHNLEFLIAK